MAEGDASKQARAREIASMVIGLAVGSSLTPFVPVPFVDDWLLERLLRRIARKVMDKGGSAFTFDEKPIVEAYLKTGDPSFGVKAATTVARFVVRKVAVVLDVKKSHDVFGEAIAFALALDSAVSAGALVQGNAPAVGVAIHQSIQMVGAGLIDAITRAGRASFSGGKPHQRIAQEIGTQVDEAWVHLDRAMRYHVR